MYIERSENMLVFPGAVSTAKLTCSINSLIIMQFMTLVSSVKLSFWKIKPLKTGKKNNRLMWQLVANVINYSPGE